MAAHAPAHVQRGVLIDLRPLLDLAVAGLAGDARIHVPHVREVDALGHLVNAHPRHGLARAPLVIVHEPLDLRALVRRRAHASNGTALPPYNEMTAQAS